MAEIVNVTYTASDGTIIPFQMQKLTRIKKANYHNWTFSPETIEKRYGVRVIRFGKSAAAYSTTLYFGGSVEDRKTRIDAFHTKIEHDIRSAQSGRLTWGDWYIDCFIRSSSTYPGDRADYTVNEVEIYAPYPFWIKPKDYSFYKREIDPSSYTFLDYPIGYEYDYTPDPAGEGTIVNDSPGAAEFKLIIYGPIVSPSVTIAGIPRRVFTGVSEGEYLTIDSRAKTIILQRQTDAINVFGLRDKGVQIFEPIPDGGSEVIWSGDFGFDLTLYRERSEPAWT